LKISESKIIILTRITEVHFPQSRSSTQIIVGAPNFENRSTDDVERFLSLIRFEQRGKLEALGLDL